MCFGCLHESTCALVAAVLVDDDDDDDGYNGGVLRGPGLVRLTREVWRQRPVVELLQVAADADRALRTLRVLHHQSASWPFPLDLCDREGCIV